MSDSALLQLLQTQTVICTATLLLVLCVRIALLRMGNPMLAYTSWLMLPLVMAAAQLPHPAAELPVFGVSLSSVTVTYGNPVLAAPDLISEQRLWLATWLAGAVIGFALMIWQQLQFRSTLGPLQAVGVARVYRAAHNAAGPLLIGLFRPRIVVPVDFATRYTAQEQALILAHEQVHLRRGDLFANAFAALVQVVFWFNPLVYFAAARFRFDQELACDMAVIQQYPTQRQSYAATILKTQMSASRLPVGCHWQAHHPLKDRIMQLTRPVTSPVRRTTMQVILMTLALCSGYSAWAVSNTETQPVAVLNPPQVPKAVPAVEAPAPVTPLAAAPLGTASKPMKKPVPAKAPEPLAPTIAELAKEAATPEPVVTANGYEVVFTHVATEYEYDERSKWYTAKINVPVLPGRPVSFGLGVDQPYGCTFKLDVKPHRGETGAAMAFAELQFKCNDSEEAPGAPKILTKLGTPATIRIGKKDQQPTHEFTLLISPKAM